jgi:cystathionine gamma-lyase
VRGRAEATRVIHAGLPAAAEGEPFLPGPTLAAAFHSSGEPREDAYIYGRHGNPTWALYEAALGELEGGHALVFSSGMAAVAAVLLSRLRPGDVLVLPSDAFYSTRAIASEHLAARGVEVRLAPTAGGGLYDAVEGASFLWLATPSNPGLDVCDIAALSARAHDQGALVAVDNTSASPLGQRPLAVGADYCVASATKHLSGHSDLLLGYVAARDPALAEELRAWRTHTGSIAGPFEVWLAHRSLATLEMRLQRQCATAHAVAEHLAARDDIEHVRYPGLPSDRSHALAARQMRHFGSVVNFTLATRERADRFIASLQIAAAATSFGGLHSSAERRRRLGAEDVPEGFVRFSAGCEDPDEIVADVAQALDRSIDGGTR